MRKIHLHFPIDNPTIEAFVFFALAIDEKLYDLTDDSFKAPALNTYTRTLELQSIALANFSAGISKDALKPFIEELEWSIGRDPALTPERKALCKVHTAQISTRLGESEQVSRGVSGLRIVLRDYFAAIQSSILNTIESSPKNKDDLIDLASSFVIQAELEGFPRRHTYHIVQNVFIQRLKYEKQIDPLKLLKSFFSAFDAKSRSFDCHFLVDSSIVGYAKLLERFGLRFEEKHPDWGNLSKQQTLFIDSQKEDQGWLIAEKIEARSPVEAHEAVTSTFDALSSVARFFEHKSELHISRLSITRDRETKQAFMSHEAPDPMHCWVGGVQYGEADHLELSDAVHGGHLMLDGAVRLSRALRFHKAALMSNSTENQLIDLWAALEGLLPTPHRESLRIEYFSDSLLPSLTLTYPEKLFTSAFRDTLKVEPKVKALLTGMECAGSEFAKFICLLLCTEYQELRKQLLQLVSSDPLLRNKLWRLADSFKSRAAVRETLKQHRRKVRWHLARIYFTRNLLMHSATSLPYLRTLVENLHLYVDTLIRVIGRVAHASPEELSIEGALQYLGGWEKHRLEANVAGEINDPPKPSEVWAVVFGQDMVLAPPFNAALVAGVEG
jgi:hypothetical protein